ncbi:MAG: DUF2461 domain-containing protein [Bacteroidales bacterium]|nr:DUF2461 domain-containing protein [Bacteroidales bacterium]
MKADIQILEFLRDLMVNNNREWFKANKERYDAAHAAFIELASHFIDVVSTIDPTIGHPDVKNCVYRIYRDVRFSADKSPYKRHMALFVTPTGRNGNLPGYYFHVEPGQSFFGGGHYCFSSDELKRVRSEICNFPDDISAAVSSITNYHHGELWGEKLKRLPAGFEARKDVEPILLHKTLCSSFTFSDDEIFGGDIDEIFTNAVSASKPLVQFINRAITAPDETVDF